MSHAVNDYSAAELADAGDVPVAVAVQLAESGDDTFAASLLAVPHAIAVAVTLAESGDDTFELVLSVAGSNGGPVVVVASITARRLSALQRPPRRPAQLST